jgi:hypothetical protein
VYRGVIGSQSNQGLRVITVGPKDPVCVSIYMVSSEGYSKLSLSKALRRYISLPIASNQSAQLVPGLGGDRWALTDIICKCCTNMVKVWVRWAQR